MNRKSALIQAERKDIKVMSLRRAEVRKIIRSHRGEAAALARQLKVTDQTVKDVLVGKTTSARILDAATVRALELMAEESSEEAVCA